jgi:chromosomal replication initiation ATPase DnaA
MIVGDTFAKILAVQTVKEQITEHIIIHVSVAMNVPKEDLILTKRKHSISHARSLCYYLLKKHACLSFRQIGKFFEVDASLVHRKCHEIESYYKGKHYPDIWKTIDLIELSLKERSYSN